MSRQFNCFDELKSEIAIEKIIISEFINNSEKGNVIELPVLTKLFAAFRTEMWNKHPDLFFYKPLQFEIYDQSKRKYPARASMLNDCSKKILLSYWDGQFNNILPKAEIENHNYKNAANLGTAFHELLQRDLSLFGIIEKQNDEFCIETEIDNPNKMITGHIDFLGNFKNIYDLDLPIVGEIKTIGSYYSFHKRDYQHRFFDLKTLGHPFHKHLIQANLYLNEIKREFELFYYVDRGISSLDVFYLYRKNPDLIKVIDKKLMLIKKHFVNKTISVIKKKTKTRCKYCAYQNICDEINTIEDIKKYGTN